MPPLTFHIHRRASDCAARVGRVTTPHGAFDTPAFMPVGTQATVKGMTAGQVASLGAQVILANTYHLLLRPGSDLIAKMGGLQAWMRWDGPVLTDSGGYQVFSLADINTINDHGVTFRSHVDGSTIELTPQRSMQVQNELGADIIMALDDCPPAVSQESRDRSQQSGPRKSDASSSSALNAGPQALDASSRLALANERTLHWLEACIQAHGRRADQALFGIVQGGVDLEQRSWCAERVAQFDLPGYAIGGVAVGEGPDEIRTVVEHTAPLLPADRPRYLMGVGYERDILVAARAGVDMFDCVLPTRNGRNANAFTPTGPIRLLNARFRELHLCHPEVSLQLDGGELTAIRVGLIRDRHELRAQMDVLVACAGTFRR